MLRYKNKILKFQHVHAHKSSMFSLSTDIAYQYIESNMEITSQQCRGKIDLKLLDIGLNSTGPNMPVECLFT
jgi:hypothetical protein